MYFPSYLCDLWEVSELLWCEAFYAWNWRNDRGQSVACELLALFWKQCCKNNIESILWLIYELHPTSHILDIIQENFSSRSVVQASQKVGHPCALMEMTQGVMQRWRNSCNRRHLTNVSCFFALLWSKAAKTEPWTKPWGLPESYIMPGAEWGKSTKGKRIVKKIILIVIIQHSLCIHFLKNKAQFPNLMRQKYIWILCLVFHFNHSFYCSFCFFPFILPSLCTSHSYPESSI